jgi:hypothetical protein
MLRGILILIITLQETVAAGIMIVVERLAPIGSGREEGGAACTHG